MLAAQRDRIRDTASVGVWTLAGSLYRRLVGEHDGTRLAGNRARHRRRQYPRGAAGSLGDPSICQRRKSLRTSPQPYSSLFCSRPVLSTVVSATLGVTSLTLSGFAQWNRYPAVWLTWWLGDAVGELIVAPLLVIWLTRPYPEWKVKPRRRSCRFAADVGLRSPVSCFCSGTPIGSEYMIILPLLWAAFRFGQHGVVTSAFIISASR